ncbi:sensor histidine kinase [Olsenella urininfantis]|uniref:sensor histidine kinase n=1 Tax=Olsenella urininfantis TaxID=1871033 RepID=UPI000984ED18|nr:HAMP domain-containing sensor histidine kinase [Olsenella urininfantis]
MLFRNRQLLLLALGCVATCAVAGLCAWRFSGPAAAGWALAGSAGASLLYLASTISRLRDIARLAKRMDDALSESGPLSLDDMREGELAVLASHSEKALLRLRLANENLEAEKRSLADSLADISHQLRTPLTSLGLDLELLRRQTSDREQLERLRRSEASLERTQWLVSALLKLARIDAGVVRLTQTPLDAAALVREAFAPLAVPYDMAGVGFSCHASAPEGGKRQAPGFLGDGAWSREAIGNILKNCLEHTPRGGLVQASVSEDALACRIRIQDSGDGIAEEDLPHIFERFWHGRGGSSSDPNPSGVGIGLSLARALVVAQGGQIRAANILVDGRVAGACFEIVFFKATV